MKCKNCNKKIKQTVATHVWYHKHSNLMSCYEVAVAEPKDKKK